MAKIVVFAGPKGGCGKTTGATSFAAWLVAQGAKVMLIDADPNKQAVSWAARRKENGAKEFPAESVVGEIRHTLKALTEDFDWIVVDTPGLDTPEIRRAIAVASVAVFPCKASTFDEQTMPLVDFMVEQVKAVREDFAGLVYLSETPAGVGGQRSREESASILGGAKSLTLLQSYTTNRKAYTNSSRNGYAAFEQGDPKAAEEFDKLAKEICTYAGE